MRIFEIKVVIGAAVVGKEAEGVWEHGVEENIWT